jgi:hypothetical protein
MTSREVISMRFSRLLCAVALSGLLSGCSGGMHVATSGFSAPVAGKFRGAVHGGQQPVSGSTIQLYAVGTTGDGSASTPLLTTARVTNQNGEFDITGNYSCPSASSLVYLSATGGNPGLGGVVNNPNIAALVVVGQCGNISATTYVNLNEVTTVAAVEALAPFMAGPAAIGSFLDDAPALSAAFTLATEYANPASGISPGQNVPAGSTVPYELINTLADAIAPCINSVGGVAGDGSNCGTLFALTSPAGVKPTADTVTALLRITQSPATNSQQIADLATPTAPYQPTVPSTPASLAVALSGPAFTLSVPMLAPASVPIGYTSPAVYVMVTNTGTSSLTISTPTITGNNPLDFNAVSQCSSLAVHSACLIAVTANPIEAGSLTASLSITESTGMAAQSLPLSTTGYATAATLLPGANVNIPFNEGTGTVAHDLTSNHNDCTFGTGTSQPAWTSTGLDFKTPQTGPSELFANCLLPSSTTTSDLSASNSRTKTWCGYLRPLTNDTGVPEYSILLGSTISNGAGALWMTSNGAQVRQAYYGGIESGPVQSNGYTPGTVPMTSTFQPTVGWHCVTGTYGSSTDNTLDHIFYDDTEVSSYVAQLAVSWDNRQAGEGEYVGYVPWLAVTGFLGITSYVVEYPQVLTPQQIASNFVALQQAAFFARGVGGPLPPNTSSTNQLSCNGDSLTHGEGSVTGYCDLVSNLDQPFNVNIIAFGGTNLFLLNANVPLIDAPTYAPNAKYNFLSQEAGIDDCSCQVVWLRELGAVLDQQVGFHVLWFAQPSLAGNDYGVQANNTQMRGVANSMNITMVDVATDPCLGATGSYADPAPCSAFEPDGLHLTTNGESLFLGYYTNVINYLTGSTAASPTNVSASTYQMLPHDRYVSVYPSGSATAITLPSCLGFGVTTPFTVVNTSATATVTVAPTSGQTPDQQINNSDAAITIPGLRSVTFVSNPLDPSTAGCTWTTQ